MAITEHTINDTLAAVLRGGRRAWREPGVVSSENTGMLRGNSRRPDILVLESGVSPVVIETEVLPAISVEVEATARLGEILRNNGKKILSSIAVRLPKRLRKSDSASLYGDLVSADDIDIAVFTGSSPQNAQRWPASEWFVGNTSQLCVLTQAATVPPDVINRAADDLTHGISDAAGLIGDLQTRFPSAVHQISIELHQDDGEQTRRMAAAIITNAFVFHENLAGSRHDLADVRSLSALRSSNRLSQFSILAEWEKILQVNYWPIFDIARRLVQHLPGSASAAILDRLAETAERLVNSNLTRSHDLTGAVFQRLIADRKFLAAYYTTPSSAALLAGLAIRPEATPNQGLWSDAASLRSTRIADFACGTGTLLSAAYTRINQLHELAGGDAAALHRDMMASGLVGCDVLPAATHLTASMLAGAHPTLAYERSSVFTLAYGRQADGAVALGSLDLISPQKTLGPIAISAKAADGQGETERETWSSLPHGSFDLVIMNPPFTRATGHEASKIGVHNPMFAAFRADAATQRSMGTLIKHLVHGTSAHGNAGQASMFLVLADKKLKKGGTLALVMPLSLMVGDSWQASRNLCIANYVDLTIVSNAGLGDGPVSFSADTDMGECLVVGRKSDVGSSRAIFVVLEERPESPSSGANIAAQIQKLRSLGRLRRLEDGPVGGMPIRLGREIIGQAIDAPVAVDRPWNLARVRDISLAQAACQLHEGTIWLPAMSRDESRSIPITTVSHVGAIGPYHADINGRNSGGGIRGPFDVVDTAEPSEATYPILWAHAAERERRLCFEADSHGIVRLGDTESEQNNIDLKVRALWNSASHCHFNRDFRFNSQSTAMQYTPRKAIGGRAWLSVLLPSKEMEQALVLWSNTTLGILMYWWSASKQQSGRGSIGKNTLAHFRVFDVSKLSNSDFKTVESVFAEFANRDFLSIDRIHEDIARIELDEVFLGRIVKLDRWQIFCRRLELLRRKLAREPSIVGGKAAHLRSANGPEGEVDSDDTAVASAAQGELALR